jgi:hypothetical protein
VFKKKDLQDVEATEHDSYCCSSHAVVILKIKQNDQLPPKRQMTFDIQTISVAVSLCIPKTLAVSFLFFRMPVMEVVCSHCRLDNWTNWPAVVWERLVYDDICSSSKEQ